VFGGRDVSLSPFERSLCQGMVVTVHLSTYAFGLKGISCMRSSSHLVGVKEEIGLAPNCEEEVVCGVRGWEEGGGGWKGITGGEVGTQIMG